MASANIINTLEFKDTTQNSVVTGSHGTAGSLATTPLSVTVTGTVLEQSGQIAALGAAVTIFDTASAPTTFKMLHFWCDQDAYVQLIGAANNVAIKVDATVPFTLTFDDVTFAANTTVLSDTTEPTTEDIAKVVINSYTSTAANWHSIVIL